MPEPAASTEPRRLYHTDMYRFPEVQPSYWEATRGEQAPSAVPLGNDEQCEVAVIGGGYTGLSAAYHLARDHGIEARVLEAGPVGWGSSGRNGGFCCLPATKLSIKGMIRPEWLFSIPKSAITS